MDYTFSIWDFVIQHFPYEPLPVKLIWISIPLFFCSTVVLVCALYHIRFKRLQATALIEKHSADIKKYILKYLSTEQAKEKKKIASALRKIVSYSDHLAEHTLEEIKDLKRSLKGADSQSLRQLFIDSDLRKYSLDKLHKRGWDIKVSGLRELVLFEAGDQALQSYLWKFINHKNDILRGEVQLALIRKNPAVGLSYMENTDKPIPNWQQLLIIEALRNQYSIPDIDFDSWLESKNKDLVVLAIKIITLYSLQKYSEQIIKLLGHKDKQIRKEVLTAMKVLRTTKSEKELAMAFEASSDFHERELIHKVHKSLHPSSDAIKFKKTIRDFNYRKIKVA